MLHSDWDMGAFIPGPSDDLGYLAVETAPLKYKLLQHLLI